MNKHDSKDLRETAATSATAAGNAEALSSVLKQSTRMAHQRAEKSGIIHQIIKRQATRDGYITYLRNLYPVYAALERGLAGVRCRTGFEVVAHPALLRCPALEADLSALAGSDWQSGMAVLQSAESYAASIYSASTSGLVAHAYVRYLGDLNGGILLRRLLGESLALVDAELAFYDFPEIDDIERFRERFRVSLDRLEPELDASAVVAEALRAFQMATDLSIEIKHTCPG